MTTLWIYLLQGFVLVFVFMLASVFGTPTFVSILQFGVGAYVALQLYRKGWPLIKRLMDLCEPLETPVVPKVEPKTAEDVKPLVVAPLKGFKVASIDAASSFCSLLDKPLKGFDPAPTEPAQRDGKIFEVMVYNNSRRMLLCLDLLNVYAIDMDEAQDVALKYWKVQSPKLDTRCLSVRPAAKQDPIDYNLEAVKIVNLPYKLMCAVWDAIKTPADQRGLRPPYVLS